MSERVCTHISGGYAGALCSKCAPALERQLVKERGKLLAIKGRLLEIVEECEEIGEDPSYLFSMLDIIDPKALKPITRKEWSE